MKLPFENDLHFYSGNGKNNKFSIELTVGIFVNSSCTSLRTRQNGQGKVLATSPVQLCALIAPLEGS